MKYLIETWGCQMNSHDSEKLEGLLLQEGYEPAAGVEDADLVLLNTCSIREKAVHKVYTELGCLREEKKQRPLLVGVAGCLAQQEQAALFKRAPQIDFVLGTMALQQLPGAAGAGPGGRAAGHRHRRLPGQPPVPPGDRPPDSTAKALVTIIEGCDHACTYCVVPTTRGPERHRPCTRTWWREVRGLVARGYREVELLGQNVNSYQGGLLASPSCWTGWREVDGLEWIRFTTSHPMNFTPELARTLVANPKVAPFLHLPVQSGSDAVLRRMRREYTVAQYLERLGYLGGGPEGLNLSTDFIVGFPGETDAGLRGDPGPPGPGAASTSPSASSIRPGPAPPPCGSRTTCPMRVKPERLTRLQARQTELTLASNQRMVGRTVKARIETEAPLDGGHWLARTANWKNVHLDGPGGGAAALRGAGGHPGHRRRPPFSARRG